jgi:hypothetical protein
MTGSFSFAVWVEDPIPAMHGMSSARKLEHGGVGQAALVSNNGRGKVVW